MHCNCFFCRHTRTHIYNIKRCFSAWVRAWVYVLESEETAECKAAGLARRYCQGFCNIMMVLEGRIMNNSYFIKKALCNKLSVEKRWSTKCKQFYLSVSYTLKFLGWKRESLHIVVTVSESRDKWLYCNVKSWDIGEKENTKKKYQTSFYLTTIKLRQDKFYQKLIEYQLGGWRFDIWMLTPTR